MFEAIPHFLIVLIYFIIIIPLTIFLVTENEMKIYSYFKNRWSILTVIFSSGFVFLLAKYVSPAFAFFFLHVLGFFGAWYSWYFRRRVHKSLFKK